MSVDGSEQQKSPQEWEETVNRVTAASLAAAYVPGCPEEKKLLRKLDSRIIVSLSSWYSHLILSYHWIRSALALLLASIRPWISRSREYWVCYSVSAVMSLVTDRWVIKQCQNRWPRRWISFNIKSVFSDSFAILCFLCHIRGSVQHAHCSSAAITISLHFGLAVGSHCCFDGIDKWLEAVGWCEIRAWICWVRVRAWYRFLSLLMVSQTCINFLLPILTVEKVPTLRNCQSFCGLLYCGCGSWRYLWTACGTYHGVSRWCSWYCWLALAFCKLAFQAEWLYFWLTMFRLLRAVAPHSWASCCGSSWRITHRTQDGWLLRSKSWQPSA